jgi:hypothetical protein
MADVGVSQITISVNATSAEQYRCINDSDQYDAVVANTRAFLSAVNESGAEMRVMVQVLEGPNGPQEIATFEEFWQPYLGRCGEIQVQPFVNWAGQIDARKVGIRYQSHNMYTRTRARGEIDARKVGISYDNGQTRYPCAHLMKNWIISREGNALPCCMVFPEDAGDLVLGNVRESSLRELFMQGHIVELRRMNFAEGLGSLRPCKDCDAYLTAPNMWVRNPLYPLFRRMWF